MQKIQNFIYWTCIGSQVSHVLCCGLPMVIGLLGLVSGLGLMATMPAGLVFLHEALHAYETLIIVTSGIIILMGWALHYIAYRIDCRNTGCVHEPCAPKKKRSGKVLMFASGLFVFNITAYLLLHY